VVQTAAAKQQSKDKHHIPSLPSGSLITGLAAAAIQHAEVSIVTSCSLLNSSDTVSMMLAIELQAPIGCVVRSVMSCMLGNKARTACLPDNPAMH
jgi:hypothetical protein